MIYYQPPRYHNEDDQRMHEVERVALKQKLSLRVTFVVLAVLALLAAMAGLGYAWVALM